MSDATERAERLAGMLILAAWNADDRELAREAAHLLREVARELATLRADLARVTEERDKATAALAAERERCAGIADSYEEREDVDTPTAIGAAIRALHPDAKGR